jgi:hypothetical protein
VSPAVVRHSFLIFIFCNNNNKKRLPQPATTMHGNIHVWPGPTTDSTCWRTISEMSPNGPVEVGKGREGA